MMSWKFIQPTTGSDGAYERGQIARLAKKIDKLMQVRRQRAELTTKLLIGRTLP